MNIAALRTFLAIVETGSLVAASRQLNVAQSTVTARLKTLEDDLGQTLLHRHKVPVEMTSSGVKFKRYAEAMTDLWRQARQETSLPSGIVDICNLGCEWDLWPTYGRNLMGNLNRDHSSTALSARPGDHQQLEHWLATGQIDAAITYRATTHEGQTSKLLASQRLICVSDRKDGPTRFDPGYIYVDAGEEFGRRHTAAFADAGIARVSFSSAVWALEFLLEHGGSAYLPEELVRPALEGGKLFHLDKAPTFERQVFFVAANEAADRWTWLEGWIERVHLRV